MIPGGNSEKKTTQELTKKNTEHEYACFDLNKTSTD